MASTLPDTDQRAVDAYRDKMWSVTVASNQNDPCVASHSEVRTGKRRWSERSGSGSLSP
jgi:hypothetical protein